jgi:hypothetical protein
MRIRCQVVDFCDLVSPSAASSSTSSKKKKSNSRGTPSDATPSLHPLIEWTQIYFQTGVPRIAWDECAALDENESLFIPPVYFQQDGHSRTLVGQNLTFLFDISPLPL